MADIILRGKTNSATVTMTDDGEGYEFACTKGAWCSIPKSKRRDSMADVINEANVHVDRHDSEDENPDTIGAPVAWETTSGV